MPIKCEDCPALEALANGFDVAKFRRFLRDRQPAFEKLEGREAAVSIETNSRFTLAEKIGLMDYRAENRRVAVFAVRVGDDLSERSSRTAQYDFAKRQLKEKLDLDAGIFAFYDDTGRFRLSLVSKLYRGTGKKEYTSWRRLTFYVTQEPGVTNKTFCAQFGRVGAFATFASLTESFSVSAVGEVFYQELFTHLKALAGVKDIEAADVRDIKSSVSAALLFVTRIVLLGFVQQKGWIGEGDKRFLQNLLTEYGQLDGTKFYTEWLRPILFEGFATAPGRHVRYGEAPWSKETAKKLQLLPFLGGGLFVESVVTDRHKFSDKAIADFFEFLFSHSFTTDEGTLDDQDLGLNPELLGIVFERLINKENGAVYTPRPEVDLMCRLSLVKWLARQEADGLPTLKEAELYKFFFPERGGVEKQTDGEFTHAEKERMLTLLFAVKVCDPAVGSGAFVVGMMQVLDEAIENVQRRLDHTCKTAYERRRDIIFGSLYGVDVAAPAVWIARARLWIALIIEAPPESIISPNPILPALDFKLCIGDSLVQRIGKAIFPVRDMRPYQRSKGGLLTTAAVKAGLERLRVNKRDFFNQSVDYELGRRIVLQANKKIITDLLDAQIDGLQMELAEAQGKLRSEQGALSFGESAAQAPVVRKIDVEKAAAIEVEISAIKEQKGECIVDTKPFIWNIDFAEIFAEQGGFDVVIGNPPYMGSDDIADPCNTIDSKEYKELLRHSVAGTALSDFPEWKTMKVDGSSNLCCYFYTRGLRLLSSTGVHCFICTNAWLDAEYGAWIQRLILDKAPLELIIDNQAKRSFATADINTIISVICSPQKSVSEKHLSRFVTLRGDFERIICSENLLAFSTAIEVATQREYNVYPVTNKDLYEAGSEYQDDGNTLLAGKYVGDKWGGKYLWAPEIYYRIMKKCNDSLDTIGHHVTGERYLNTGGADKFFIIENAEPTDENMTRIINEGDSQGKDTFNDCVESRYLRPLIKDALKKTKTIMAHDADANCVVVDETPSSALKRYIDWGERQHYNERSVTKQQKPWYKPTRQMTSGGPILVPRSFGDTFAIHYNPDKILSLRFYRLHPKADDAESLVAYLNSTLFWLIYEALGNKSQGQGVLDFSMASLLRMRIPIVLNNDAAESVRLMYNRPIKNIYDEVGINPKLAISIEEQAPNPMPDRKRLDDVVFDALNLSPEERTEVYRAICRLVWNRINKANSV